MKNSKWASTILTCIGTAGVVVTSVLTAKATPKAMKICEELRNEKVNNYEEEPTKLDYVKAAWKCYIPAIVAGASTITCIFGANVLNMKAQASLASAYALLDSSYKDYQKKVEELYGKEGSNHVRDEIIKEKYDGVPEPMHEDEELFFDMNTMNYFTANIDDVIHKTVIDDGSEEGIECYCVTLPVDLPWYVG